MIAIREHLRALGQSERGATAIEYGLICALIVIAMMTALQTLAGGSGTMWGRIQTAVQNYM
ncbi:MAG TPA: Flp family type IVb pilin [Sphingomicrobium sp.]|nr:Flp family type IVb pilin [Sphingomicrobium sp.]